jgi:nucleoside-diphosphate-sugar epimerase
MKILITGGNGYIGRSLHSYLYSKHDVTIVGRQDFDLTNPYETIKFFSDKSFDVVIHTAVVGGRRDKQEDSSVIDQNLKMYYNLLDVKHRYTKFITFGSGAEQKSTTPYGLSKFIINQSIKDKPNFYNIRIFGVFDENELGTRFIKANIKRYINKEAIQIFEDKMMDFIYMKDLITLVEHYINNDDLPKEIDCMYLGKKSYLYDIAEIINKLDNYEVPILSGKNASSYVGHYHPLNLDFIGLENGIKETYNKLKNEY